jgi:glutamyl-tRNA synthetase/nondiscriminating glutamyl-tRNA synthetase
VNRHYLKAAEPARLVQLAWPHLRAAGFVNGDVPNGSAIGFLATIMPMASGSVDRLDQVPDRLRLVFWYDARAALSLADIREEVAAAGARQVIEALADDLATAPRLVDRQTFRAAADRVKQKTGQKGRALFHPIRLALTSASEGPELDLLIPAVDQGADLDVSAGLAPITGCRERARAFVDELSRTNTAD